MIESYASSKRSMLFAMLCISLPVGGRCEDPANKYSPLQFKQNIEIADFVTRAADALKERGEEAFAEMNKEGPWCNKETGRYVFVYDTGLVTVVNAGFPEMMGRRVAAEDPRKLFACDQLLAGARSEVWCHADWWDAATHQPGCKTAFFKLAATPDGARYIVGSGALNVPMERRFVEELVDSAAALYEAQGTNAFEFIARADGPFRFRDFYIFVDNPQHVELLNPAFPDVVGQDFSDVRGANGRYFVREYVAMALNEGSGWTEYDWPRPGETTPSRKSTYARKAEFEGQVAIVGAGLYLMR